MARLRQQHPQNYVNSGNIHTDFENLIRYINSAELGNKTIGELFGILFNEEGVPWSHSDETGREHWYPVQSRTIL